MSATLAASGLVTDAVVTIDAEAAMTDPTTPEGRHVLMHELAHAVGLGHAADGSDEVMDPVTRAGDAGVLGDGDLAALAAVGCG